ncbi:MAG TPA: RecX family transcriptional regulator [Magnetospirillaceae bacterium]|jgi:regulatory protein
MSKSRAKRPLDQDGLEKAAIHYLERFSSSVAGLRRVLSNRLRRAGQTGDTEAGEGFDGKAAIEAVIAKLIRTGLLDDARYAEFRAGALARRGSSLFTIKRDLKTRGVAPSLIEAAVGNLRDEAGGTSDEADRQAAQALARRRRIGPYRPEDQRAAFRHKDLATLGRAGFDFEIAKSVVDGERENG